MKLPAVRGTIERRILVNYVVDPEALQNILPDKFRPKLVGDVGVAGICLIRLGGMRPAGIPLPVGPSSENAAHRIAVEWTEGNTIREGVFIPRRDTSSRLNTLIGGRLFPGIHHHARFRVEETHDTYKVSLRSDDGTVSVAVEGRITTSLPPSSVFRSVKQSSAFFEGGSVGYSATPSANRLDGLELETKQWEVTPLHVNHVHSSFFEDANKFPPGSAHFDHALVMTEIAHEWHALRPLYTEGLEEVAAPA